MNRLQKLAAMAKARKADGLLILNAENLCYATGFVGLEGMVLVTADGKGLCFTDSRYIEAAEKAVAPMGYQVIDPKEGYPAVAAQVCRDEKLETLLFEDRSLSVAEFHRYESAVPARLIPVEDGISRLRQVKEEVEVEHIVAAQRIAEQALDALLPLIKPGAVEKELAAELDYRMARFGSTGVSFQTILVSGAKSSMPHGVPGDKKIEAGDFVTIDFGAMAGGYHSDMTRTFAVGYATDEMKTVYNTVLQAQLAGIEAFAPGKIGRDVDEAARKVIRDAGYGEYFGHSLGHSVGLNIHEAPNAAPKSEAAFEIGNVVTMEPGIYIPGKFGVRIEDMVYLSAEGKRNLTRYPKELTIL